MLKRDKYRITYEILKNCRLNMSKTRLMFACNLNYVILTKYTNELIAKGLIIEDQGKYTLTPKGLEFLKLLDTYIKLNEEINKLENLLHNF